MVNEWYYQLDGEDIGPVPFDTIKELARSGTLTPDTQIRDAVSGMLLPAKAIGGLFPDLPSAKAANISKSIQKKKTKPPSSSGRTSHQQIMQELDAMEESRPARTRPSLDKPRPAKRPIQESPSLKTREAASRIQEYAQSVSQNGGEQEESKSSSAIVEGIKEHPVITFLLVICIGVGIYLKRPLPDHSSKYLRQLEAVYAELKVLTDSEDTTDEEFQLFVDRTETKFENIESKLFNKEDLSRGDELIQTIIRRQLRPLLDSRAPISPEKDEEIQRYMDEVNK